MNVAFLMDAILVVFIALMVFLGFKRGAVKSLYGLLAAVVSGLAAFFLGPLVGTGVIMPFMGITEDKVYDAIMPLVEKVEGAFNLGALFEKLPEEFTSLIDRCGGDINSLKDSFGSITEGTEDNVRELAQAIAGPVNEYVSKGIGCVAVFLVVLIVVLILKRIILPVMKLPLLKQADKLLGIAVGAVSGFAYAWIICIAVSVFVEFSLVGSYNETLAAISQSSFLFRFFCDLSPMDLVNVVSVFN